MINRDRGVEPFGDLIFLQEEGDMQEAIDQFADMGFTRREATFLALQILDAQIEENIHNKRVRRKPDPFLYIQHKILISSKRL